MNKSVKNTQGLAVGDIVQDFTLTDVNERAFNLYRTLAHKKVVLVFIRGQWCPFCNKYLKALESQFSAFEEKGAQVVILSPESSPFIKKTLQKTKVSYAVLHDKDLKVAQQFNLIFNPTKLELIMYNTLLGAQMGTAHENKRKQLPVPATYIINQDKRVIWRHFEHDYKKRSNPTEIIKHL